mmetsp:Transcript_27440/g.45158  ORF Transcript_27440/g.45158 Transcript_27440/m.45158 type:complete len:507 (-) Transcript_27440:160-1680(-)
MAAGLAIESVVSVPHSDSPNKSLLDARTVVCVWPHYADVKDCRDGGGRTRPVTGTGSATWFRYGGGGSERRFMIEPGLPIIIRASGDMCPGTGCCIGRVAYSVHERSSEEDEWTEILDFDYHEHGLCIQRWQYFVPSKSELSLRARGSFYFGVHQQEFASAKQVREAIEFVYDAAKYELTLDCISVIVSMCMRVKPAPAYPEPEQTNISPTSDAVAIAVAMTNTDGESSQPTQPPSPDPTPAPTQVSLICSFCGCVCNGLVFLLLILAFALTFAVDSSLHQFQRHEVRNFEYRNGHGETDTRVEYDIIDERGCGWNKMVDRSAANGKTPVTFSFADRCDGSVTAPALYNATDPNSALENWCEVKTAGEIWFAVVILSLLLLCGAEAFWAFHCCHGHFGCFTDSAHALPRWLQMRSGCHRHLACGMIWCWILVGFSLLWAWSHYLSVVEPICVPTFRPALTGKEEYGEMAGRSNYLVILGVCVPLAFFVLVWWTMYLHKKLKKCCSR